MPLLAYQDAAASGINLVRFWGFADGPTPVPSDAVQPEVRACATTICTVPPWQRHVPYWRSITLSSPQRKPALLTPEVHRLTT